MLCIVLVGQLYRTWQHTQPTGIRRSSSHVRLKKLDLYSLETGRRCRLCETFQPLGGLTRCWYGFIGESLLNAVATSHWVSPGELSSVLQRVGAVKVFVVNWLWRLQQWQQLLKQFISCKIIWNLMKMWKMIFIFHSRIRGDLQQLSSGFFIVDDQGQWQMQLSPLSGHSP